jgi:hypothetical protein
VRGGVFVGGVLGGGPPPKHTPTSSLCHGKSQRLDFLSIDETPLDGKIQASWFSSPPKGGGFFCRRFAMDDEYLMKLARRANWTRLAIR